ncbi:MAG: transcription elongation factor GreA [Lachnospiraceae bacterium]|nr:transcription elongation factor GreA [Lachnospiraceae bacterium]
MEGKKYILTAEGLKRYEDELYYLKNERYKEITQAIKEARAQGDLSENAEYQAAKEEQRQVDARIEELEEMLNNVEVVDESEDTSVVRIGSMVRIKDLELDEELDYQIVGPSEANTDEDRISNESPLGQALIGAAEGEVVSVQAPVGEIRYQVMEIGKREKNRRGRDTESE